MALPQRPISYPHPDYDMIRSNIGNWNPDPSRSVLLVHDMQRYFLRAFDPESEPFLSLTRNTVKCVSAARRYSIPVIYSLQPGAMSPKQRGLLTDFWGPGMDSSSADRSIVDAIAPQDESELLTKWRYSAFSSTDLEERLHDYGATQVAICGVYGHIGVYSSALDAFSKGFQTFLPIDAVADFSENDHKLTGQLSAELCARVLRTEEIVEMWAENRS